MDRSLSAALIRGAVTGSWRAAAGPTAAATALATAATIPDVPARIFAIS